MLNTVTNSGDNGSPEDLPDLVEHILDKVIQIGSKHDSNKRTEVYFPRLSLVIW